MTGVYADTSLIVDGQQIDANDVKTPIDALDTALAGYASGSNSFTRIVVNNGATPGTIDLDGANIGTSGGQVNLFGAGAYPDWALDVVGDNVRLRRNDSNAVSSIFYVRNENTGGRVNLQLLGDFVAEDFGGSPGYYGQRYNGTLASPTAAAADDIALLVRGQGYYTSGGPGLGNLADMRIIANQIPTSTARGGRIEFYTVADDAVGLGLALTIHNDKSVQVEGALAAGGLSINGTASISIVNPTAALNLLMDTYVDSAGGVTLAGRKARGALGAETAVQSGDTLMTFDGRGYGSTAFSTGRASMQFIASQIWTDANQGAQIRFDTTPNNSAAKETALTIHNDKRLQIEGDLDHNGDLIGFRGTTPVTIHTYTQTYTSANRVLDAYTADSQGSAYTGLATGQGGTPYAKLTDLNALRVAYENLAAMCLDLLRFANVIVDDLQEMGILG